MITAVVVEGRSQSEVGRAYGVSQSWISRLVARYRAEGEAAFEAWSRRPVRSPSATAPEVVELVLRLRTELAGQGLDAGAYTICWHLHQHHQISVSAATVWRVLSRHGQITPEPTKRPRSSYTRFEAELPNPLWQTEVTHDRLSTGEDAEILNFLDDHSRYLLACLALPRVTGKSVVTVFRNTIAGHGVPTSVLWRQRHGVHHPLRGRSERAQRLRDRTPPTRCRAEEFLPEPPSDLRQDRTLPPNPQTLTGHPTRPTGHVHVAAGPARPVRAQVQHLPSTPLPQPAHSHRGLPRPTQGHTHTDQLNPTQPDTRIRRDRIDDSSVLTPRYHALVHCGLCGRRMQGQQSKQALYYRCRFPTEYALANKIEHPRNIYLAERELLPPLDEWLANSFTPHHLTDTIEALHDAQPDLVVDPAVVAAEQVIHECDAKLARYRAALEAGTDPTLVARWTTEVQARRAKTLAPSRQPTSRRRMSKEEIRSLGEALGNIRAVLTDAEPEDRAEIYRQLGLHLTYQPAQRLVRAETHLDPHSWGYGSCPRGDLRTNHPPHRRLCILTMTARESQVGSLPSMRGYKP